MGWYIESAQYKYLENIIIIIALKLKQVPLEYLEC